MVPDKTALNRPSVQQAEEPAASTMRLTRRHVLFGAAGLAGVSGASTAVYAGAVEPNGLVVTRYAPAPRGWPADRRLTITVIADLHAGGPDMLVPSPPDTIKCLSLPTT